MLQPDRVFTMHLERWYKKYFGGSLIIESRGFSEDVKCIFGFTDKFFFVACDDWNHIPMEGLG